MKRNWRVLPCPTCSGCGIVSQYSYDDFEGPNECRECSGSGRLWIRPSNHCFAWPGGPTRGLWPGAYTEAKKP